MVKLVHRVRCRSLDHGCNVARSRSDDASRRVVTLHVSHCIHSSVENVAERLNLYVLSIYSSRVDPDILFDWYVLDASSADSTIGWKEHPGHLRYRSFSHPDRPSDCFRSSATGHPSLADTLRHGSGIATTVSTSPASGHTYHISTLLPCGIASSD